MHDDEPVIFEFMLHFFYNDHPDLTLCDTYSMKSEENQQKHLFMPVQLHGIGDKYNATPLQIWAAKVLKENLSGLNNRASLSDEICCRLVREYYSLCLKPMTTVGTILAEYLVRNRMDFIRDSLCFELIQELPIFGSDILLVVRSDLWKLNR
jgi:hypothetical protein